MADELRRVLRSRDCGAAVTFAGIDPVATDPVEVAAVLASVITKRMRWRFKRLGIGYHAPPGTPAGR